MTRRAMIAALGALLLAPLATHARAEVSELRMATQFGIGATAAQQHRTQPAIVAAEQLFRRHVDLLRIAVELLAVGVGEGGLALDKSTGAIVWKSKDNNAGYSTPLPVRRGADWLALLSNESAYLAVEMSTGKPVWRFRWLTEYGVNAADPVLAELGDRGLEDLVRPLLGEPPPPRIRGGVGRRGHW